jgi:hypothetical protein
VLPERVNPPYKGKHAQRDQVADAIYDTLIAGGEKPGKATKSRAFAIATAQLQKLGYLKPGTATPTPKGAGKIGAIMRRNPTPPDYASMTLPTFMGLTEITGYYNTLTGRRFAQVESKDRLFRTDVAVRNGTEGSTVKGVKAIKEAAWNQLRYGTGLKNPRTRR